MSSYPVKKRALDLSLSVFLLIVLSPVFVFLFVAMTVDMLRCSCDRGPWLYRETRISRGREFHLLKFRTLRREVLRGMDERSHARMLEADRQNLTWSGRRLLKPRYLDELPQLWNILRGDMSLVGPRPWPPSMVANQVQQGLTYRNDFVAGWTGPAQVQKGSIESAGFAQLDSEYVAAFGNLGAWTLFRRDLALLSATFRTIARGEGLRY